MAPVINAVSAANSAEIVDLSRDGGTSSLFFLPLLFGGVLIGPRRPETAFTALTDVDRGIAFHTEVGVFVTEIHLAVIRQFIVAFDRAFAVVMAMTRVRRAVAAIIRDGFVMSTGDASRKGEILVERFDFAVFTGIHNGVHQRHHLRRIVRSRAEFQELLAFANRLPRLTSEFDGKVPTQRRCTFMRPLVGRQAEQRFAGEFFFACH